MAKSRYAEQLDAIQGELRGLLREQGFRKRGRTYHRLTVDSLTHVIQFQMGRYDPPGTTYIPGLRSNMWGQFAVNLGVYVPEAAELYHRSPRRKFVSEADCSIRVRLGELICARGGEYWWFIKPDPDVAEDVGEQLESHGFPFLERFSTRDQVLRDYRRLYDKSEAGCGDPPRILMAVILAVRGDPERARALLAEQARSTDIEGHRTFVREFAVRLGVGEIES